MQQEIVEQKKLIKCRSCSYRFDPTKLFPVQVEKFTYTDLKVVQ